MHTGACLAAELSLVVLADSEVLVWLLSPIPLKEHLLLGELRARQVQRARRQGRRLSLRARAFESSRHRQSASSKSSVDQRVILHSDPHSPFSSTVTRTPPTRRASTAPLITRGLIPRSTRGRSMGAGCMAATRRRPRTASLLRSMDAAGTRTGPTRTTITHL